LDANNAQEKAGKSWPARALTPPEANHG
jgi:hypothetical protein